MRHKTLLFYALVAMLVSACGCQPRFFHTLHYIYPSLTRPVLSK